MNERTVAYTYVDDTEDRATNGLRFYGLVDGVPHFLGCDWFRIWNLDRLPQVRCLLVGPRWKRGFNVQRVPIADLIPAREVPWHRPGRRVLVFTLEEDIRERVLMGLELRPGVVAQW